MGVGICERGGRMNTQEAIKRVEQMGEYESFVDEPISKKSVLDIISKIDDPEKPVVPQFVAYWYEENKDDFEYSLYKLCIKFHEKILSADLYGWFNDNNNKCIETLVKMKLYGYEVKEVKE